MDCVLAITQKENRNAMVVVADTRILLLAVKSLDAVLRRKNLRHVENARISLVQDSQGIP